LEATRRHADDVGADDLKARDTSVLLHLVIGGRLGRGETIVGAAASARTPG
jgi:hypothetical protein